MKGHVGGGSGVWRIQGALGPLKSKPVCMSFTYPYVMNVQAGSLK
jgi:hypothetical protein